MAEEFLYTFSPIPIVLDKVVFLWNTRTCYSVNDKLFFPFMMVLEGRW